MTELCTRCRRPLKRPSPTGMGPVCSKVAPGPVERDLFGYDIERAAAAAFQRLRAAISLDAALASYRVQEAFAAARRRLGVAT